MLYEIAHRGRVSVPFVLLTLYLIDEKLLMCMMINNGDLDVWLKKTWINCMYNILLY